ncbi:DNA-binding protein [Mycobacterium kansasii]|uniref:YbaB/EbfC family nucleoid-associated protein n=1 Tax=Mycobacterium kansasii TaxID=1768 RepID=UPI000CDE096D|nr:YbaB/EbfC family nucleoid-associated protein [Mycobacterium kansasii]POX87786.1 DNA-binding protein [Mycobacterium kansasii]POY02782.1 DNA-binding protein [Mycobacterium kansasii]POY18017.1 DNA-binding protein [Mycobacterium kansasii]POY30983.1 DNA-binding protein [Mycobacterium kansasii]
MFDQADVVMSLLDQQVHRMDAEAFTATHQTGAVEVTVNGHRRLIGLSINPGILGMCAHDVARMINETISAATDYAQECMADDVAELADSIADALAVMRDLPPPA